MTGMSGIKVLEERGFDVNSLPRKCFHKGGSVMDVHQAIIPSASILLESK